MACLARYSRTMHSVQDAETEILSADFIKKYIEYAKATTTPQMSEAAATKISQAYATLRTKARGIARQAYSRFVPSAALSLVVAG